MRGLALATMLLPAIACAGDDFVRVPAGAYRSALGYVDVKGDTAVAAFDFMATPVTNAQYLAFVQAHPEWRRDRVVPVYADAAHYLANWKAPLDPGDAAKPRQPVTGVSWFAASAYCEAAHARLPTWVEWEYTAAADETRRDARDDPAWRERILGWYAKPSSAPLAEAGVSPSNVYGVRDLHGLVWEWVEDFGSLLVIDDSRDPADAIGLKFCGSGALNMRDVDNYAVLMRVALLSSVQAADSTSSLGFRCARSVAAEGTPP